MILTQIQIHWVLWVHLGVPALVIWRWTNNPKRLGAKFGPGVPNFLGTFFRPICRVWTHGRNFFGNSPALMCIQVSSYHFAKHSSCPTPSAVCCFAFFEHLSIFLSKYVMSSANLIPMKKGWIFFIPLLCCEVCVARLKPAFD